MPAAICSSSCIAAASCERRLANENHYSCGERLRLDWRAPRYGARVAGELIKTIEELANDQPTRDELSVVTSRRSCTPHRLWLIDFNSLQLSSQVHSEAASPESRG
jgi:hypothetical protein